MSTQSLATPLFARACLSSNMLCCELSICVLALLTVFVSSRQTFNVIFVKITCLFMSLLMTITGLGWWCFIAAILSSALLLSRNT